MPEDITDVTNSPDYQEPVKVPNKPEKPKLTAADFFRPIQFSSDDVQSTMGVSTDHITPELLIKASQKLLQISKGETEDDDRDSLEHQRMYGVTEYLPEHIQRDAGRVARQMLWKATQRNDLSWIPSGALNAHVDSVFNDSLLAKYIDGSNPFEAIDNNTSVTRIGEGGVGNQRMAPAEMRDVHNSFLGYIDPVRCFSERHFIETRNEGFKSITSITENDEIMLWSQDAIQRSAKPTKIHKYDYNEDLYGYDDGTVAYEVTGNHRMIARKPGTKEWKVYYASSLHGHNAEIPDPRAKGLFYTLKKESYKRIPFAGPVYCVSVPGEQIITKIPGRLPFAVMNSPESLRVGLDVYLSKNTRKGSDGKLYTRALNAHTGKEEWVDSVTLAKANVATAEFAPGGAYEKDETVPIPRGKHSAVSYVDRKDIDYYMTRTDEMLSLAANNVPMASASREMRILMGCLHPSTVIHVYRKGQHIDVPIAKYIHEPGDLMYCVDRSSKVFLETVRKVTKLSNTYYIYKISTDEKQSALVTENHKWMVSRRGIIQILPTSYLQIGDRIPCTTMTAQGPQGPVTWKKVSSIQKLKTKCSYVYDIDVNDHQYFLSNGLSTHNSKYLPQSIPLDHREAPLVSTIDPDTGDRIEKSIGNMLGVRRASAPGVVTAVRKDRIDVQYKDGTKGSYELYQNFPMNQKGFMNSEPMVKAGDSFNKGDLLAVSNYTDKEGNSAAGTNLRGAYLPWKGLNYEDAYVVSESAARNKLASSVMYKSKVELAPNISTNKNSYSMWKPGQYSKEQLDKMDDTGVIKPGMTVMPGDPLVLAMRYEKPAPGSFKKAIVTDISETWDHDEPGIITDAVRTRTGVRVNVKVSQPAQVGDKISARYGAKGVISAILPDSQMPQDEKGNAFEVILPPLGIVTRTNTQMLYEPLLGKIAQKTGKPILVPEFMKENMDDYVLNLAKEHHVSETETVIDPETGRKIKNVGTGPMYFYKLKHLAEAKEGARGTARYSVDDVPSRGGYEGSKRLSNMESTALAGHNAFSVLKDAKVIRGQANSEFWRSIQTGTTPVMPGEPTVYKKFYAHLQAAGINVKRTDNSVQVFPLTDTGTKELTGSRELHSSDTFTAKDYQPINGGLFGKDLFGQDWDEWAYIQLDEPLPNPVMEDPIRKALNLTQKDFEAIVSGTKTLNGKTGGQAIYDALKGMNVKLEAAKALQDYKEASKSKKDDALKRYTALELMTRNGVPAEQYMLTRIPVLPPKFRPIMQSGDTTMVADSNYLYKQMVDMRNDLRDAKALPEEYQQEARANLYRAWKELAGLYEPTDPKLKNKKVKGLLGWVLGNSGKTSAYQQKLLTSTVDMASRGVIVPDPTLKLNEVGIPVTVALEQYKPFVVRSLVNSGYTPAQALEMVDKQGAKSQLVMDHVRSAMGQRPLIMNRAPTLHKLSIMAFKPRITAGHVFRVNPSIVGAYAADFDGDTVQNLIGIWVSQEILKQNSKKVQNSTCIFDNVGVDYSKNPKQEGGSSMLKTEEKVDVNGIVGRLQDIPVIQESMVQKSPTVTEWDVPEGYFVHALNIETGEQGLHKVAKLSKHTGLTMYDVELETKGAFRHIITASEDHSLITYNGITCAFEKTPPKESEGRMVPKIEMDKANHHTICTKTVRIGNQVPLGFDLGVFLGAMIADGWVDANGTIRMATGDKSLRTYFMEHGTVETCPIPLTADAEAFRYEPKESFGTSDKYRITFYADWDTKKDLKALIGSGAENKQIPWPCLMGSRAHLTGLLVGLLSTDGSIGYSFAKGKKSAQKMISYNTTSPILRDGIQSLCLKLGIRTSALAYRGKNSTMDCYMITLSIGDVVRFYKSESKFRLIHEPSQQRLEQIVHDVEESTNADQFDMVPFPVGLKGEFSYAKVSDVINVTVVTRLYKQGFSTRDRALDLVKVLENTDWSMYKVPQNYNGNASIVRRTPEEAEKAIKAWCALVKDTTLHWEHVACVSKSACTEGWDITVPGPYTFATWTGTVVQDTMVAHVPVSTTAIKDAETKMMPEDNLIKMRNNKITYPVEKEYLEGLYLATRKKDASGIVKRYKDIAEARQAFRDGTIDIDTPIEILEK